MVAAGVEFVNVDWPTTRLLHVHPDITLDGTALVVTAKHLAEVAVGDGQLHVAVHIRIVRTGKQQRNLC